LIQGSVSLLDAKEEISKTGEQMIGVDNLKYNFFLTWEWKNFHQNYIDISLFEVKFSYNFNDLCLYIV